MGGSPSCFFEVSAPRTDKLQALLGRITKRITKFLIRTGYLIAEQGISCLDGADSLSALTPLQAVACTYRIALGPKGGTESAEPAIRPQPTGPFHATRLRRRARL